MKSAIGIDPGITGYAFLLFENMSYQFFQWPGEEKAHRLLKIWKDVHSPALAALEKIPFIPGGQYASHKLNRNVGQWGGLLRGLDIKCYNIPPKEWQALLFPPRPNWTTTKHRAVFTAQELIPGLGTHVRLKGDHNKADAALIALAALRRALLRGG